MEPHGTKMNVLEIITYGEMRSISPTLGNALIYGAAFEFTLLDDAGIDCHPEIVKYEAWQNSQQPAQDHLSLIRPIARLHKRSLLAFAFNEFLRRPPNINCMRRNDAAAGILHR